MCKKSLGIIFCLLIFSSQSIAKPWFEFNFKRPNFLKTDNELIESLNEIIENEKSEKLFYEDHKLIVSRIVSSELANEDVLEKLIEAIRLSKYSLARTQLLEKYLLQILDSKQASVTTSENILNFIKSERLIIDSNHSIVKKIIAKHKGLDNEVLISAVHVVLASNIPSMDEVKREVIISVISELKGHFVDLCMTSHALEDYYTDSTKVYNEDLYIGFTSISDKTLESLKKLVFIELGKAPKDEYESEYGCPSIRK